MTAKELHIFDTFEHSWLCRKYRIFDTCSASRWRCNHFRSKLEFWAEIFCGQSFYAKNQLYRHGKPFFAQKMFKRAKNLKSKIISMSWKRLQCHLGPYILKSFEHVGMFKTYQKVKKQVWFYPAMLLIVSCLLLQTVCTFKKIFDLKFNVIDKYYIKFNVPLFEFKCHFQNIDK